MLHWIGIGPPPCPVSPTDQVWIERTMRSFVDWIGLDRIRTQPIIRPSAEYFPDPFDGSPESAERHFRRMCGYMGVDPGQVTFCIEPDHVVPHAGGYYEERWRSRVVLLESNLETPELMLTIMAHELAHERLFKSGRTTHTTEDLEFQTDLLPVALGCGIFAANSTVRETNHHDGITYAWSVGRLGYLTSVQLGYALGILAFVRREERPPWFSDLRHDAQSAAKAGLRLLRKGGPSVWHINSGQTPFHECLRLISSRYVPERLFGLQQFILTEPVDSQVKNAVRSLLLDPHEDVRVAAVRRWVEIGDKNPDDWPLIFEMALSDLEPIRNEALRAIGVAGGSNPESVDVLLPVVRHGDRAVFDAAITALAKLWPVPTYKATSVIETLVDSLKTGDLKNSEMIVESLSRFDESHHATIEASIQELDEETRRVLRRMWIER